MEANTSQSNGGSDDFSSNETEFIPEEGFYQPSREDTWEAYQALLSIIEYQLGTPPQHIICTAADEILSVLKNESITNPIEKRFELEKLLKPIDNETFKQLVQIARNITDYSQARGAPSVGSHYQGTRKAYREEIYRPRFEETRKAYKLILDVIRSQLRSLSTYREKVVAHEILSILKDEKVSMVKGEKKTMIESSLGGVSDDTFEFLVFVGGLIFDFEDGTDDVGLDMRPSSWGDQETEVVKGGAEAEADRCGGIDLAVVNKEQEEMQVDQTQVMMRKTKIELILK